ncbi:hypothetical protein CYMTET_18233 [Cymbomonas tetramitiformis]|uniref:HAT C-terminal dimerisation domain-containing protein n=1 Tax=Cymbomonas tetramitiformis TaxID=36881 RepID=A0AAE0L647_9CHLO|nr:hypothetical protein CYMTET_18233 [Cymbomonas tetramitiformis]
MIGKLARVAKASTPLKYEGKPVQITNLDVMEARATMYNSITKRYFTAMMECKVEDFSVATVLDPRYKNFKFKGANDWLKGKLARETAVKWTRKAWEADWKPKKVQVSSGAVPPSKITKSAATITVASFLADSDDEEEAEEATTAVDELKDELTSYLELPDVPLSIDLQFWWKEHRKDFPHLAKMADSF